MAKKVTMQQIANYLGVSKFVVSKALSGKGGVSEATKDRVIEAAARLGYLTQRGVSKSAISTGVTASKQSVLVLMPNIRFQTKESLYWGRILDGISAELDERGIGIVILSEQNIENLANFINPEGILGMIGVGEVTSSMLLEIQRLGISMVLVDHEDDLVKLDSIFVDNFEATNRLTKQFLNMGKSEIAFIGDIHYSRSFFDRFLGYRSAMDEHQYQLNYKSKWLEQSLVNLEGTSNDVYIGQIEQWLSRYKQLPQVLICGNDEIALSTMSVLKSRGVNVPSEVFITGFDNIEASYRTEIPLTTVHVPKELLGKKAVERLINRMKCQDEPSMKLLIQSEIIYRESTSLTIS